MAWQDELKPVCYGGLFREEKAADQLGGAALGRLWPASSGAFRTSGRPDGCSGGLG